MNVVLARDHAPRGEARRWNLGPSVDRDVLRYAREARGARSSLSPSETACSTPASWGFRGDSGELPDRMMRRDDEGAMRGQRESTSRDGLVVAGLFAGIGGFELGLATGHQVALLCE